LTLRDVNIPCFRRDKVARRKRIDMNAKQDTMPAKVRTRLSKATYSAHVRLNRNPMLHRLTEASLTLADYLNVIQAYDFFYQRLESRIAQATPLIDDAFPYASRAKTGWLATDLSQLGIVTLAQPPLAETEWDFGMINGIGQLAGVLYVIEGSTLGGQVIGRHLEKNLGLTHDSGARFFHGYGTDTEAYWQEFCFWLEKLSLQAEQIERAEHAARTLFSKLETLLGACSRSRPAVTDSPF
jgi:heme oxygenase